MIKSKQITIASISLIIIVPILLMFQGLDFTDTGWMLTYFQNIFSNPESVTFWFHLYLTNVIGGIWNIFFGNFGLLGFKFGGVIILWFSTLGIYNIFKDFIHKNYIFIGIILGFVFYFSDKVTIIHYNNLSLLFTIFTILFIKKALNKKQSFLLIAGILVAFNSFVRLPNIVNGLFLIPIIYYRVKTGKTLKVIINDIMLCFLGFFIGVFLILGLMKVLGHLDIYLNSIVELFSSTDSSDSNYNLLEIVRRFIKQFARATIKGGIFFVFLFPISYFYNKLNSKYIKYFFSIILVSIFVFFYLAFLSFDIQIFYQIMIGLILLTFIVMFFNKKGISSYIKAISMLSILSIMTLSLGSDTGMKVGSYGVMIGFPIFLWYWSEFSSKIIPIKLTINTAILFFIFISAFFLITTTYRDSSNRLLMNSSIKHKLLKGIKTTESRSTLIVGLIDELENMDIKNNTLLCFESIGMVHYLTETKPYISNPWPLMELPVDLERLLRERELDFLPIIVLANKETRSKTWPNINRLSLKPKDIKMREIVNDFIIRNNYTESFSNEMFTILEP